MEERVFEVVVTLTNVYQVSAKDGAEAARIAAEDYIWGENAAADIEVTLMEGK